MRRISWTLRSCPVDDDVVKQVDRQFQPEVQCPTRITALTVRGARKIGAGMGANTHQQLAGDFRQPLTPFRFKAVEGTQLQQAPASPSETRQPGLIFAALC